MFTGIIEDQGTIKKIARQSDGTSLTIQSGLPLAELRLGDSIAVDGICLTITDFTEKGFIMDVSPESLNRTTLGLKREGDPVNLERALRLADRLGGHMVSGHIDGIGVIKSIRHKGNALQIDFGAPKEILAYIIEKGSVAVDGISLTVNQCTSDGFNVMVIPFTATHTTIPRKKVGDMVNIENDLIGKYVKKFLLGEDQIRKGITREFLERFDFS
jgi:riboflavin synthase